MEARAYLKYARIAPRKVQIVLDLIRNKPTKLALAILKHTPKAACEPVEKLLKSAIANAENNHNMDVTTSMLQSASLAKAQLSRELDQEHRAEHLEYSREHPTSQSFSKRRNSQRRR